MREGLRAQAGESRQANSGLGGAPPLVNRAKPKSYEKVTVTTESITGGGILTQCKWRARGVDVPS